MSDLKATLKTNRGDIVLNLFPDHAPTTVENFTGLAEGTKEYRDDAGRSGERYYDGLGFHRVIEGFMAQTGCPQGTGTGGSSYPNLPAEFNKEPHVRGVCSMARSSAPNSANSQFFICFDDATFLDRKYTLWGRVAEGMEIVDQINRGEPPANPDKIVSAKIAADSQG